MSDPQGAALRVGAVDGEPAVTLAAGQLEATFLPGLGLALMLVGALPAV